MPDVSLNGIEFEIKGSTDAASSSIDNLIGKLGALNNALSEVANIKKLATGLNSLKKAIDNLNSADLDKIKASLESFGQVSESLSGLSSMSKDLASFMRALSKLAENPENVLDLAQALNVLGSVDLTNLQNAEGALRALADALAVAGRKSTAAKAVRDVGREAKKANTPLRNFLASIKRIAFYRILRGILKIISQGFQEGLTNAYQFSKLNGGDLADSLDLVASKSLTMKNQLGAAFGALLNAIAPVVVAIISLITRLANALSMLFSAVGGGSQYKKAKDAWTDWGDAAAGAGGAAKEALRYLAPFDELNRLPSENSGGGGGGSSLDPEDMFEYQDLPEWLQNFADKLQELAASMKITFNDVFFDWSDLTGEQIAEKAITGLSALLGAGVGFMIGGVPGAIIGTLVGTTIGLEISSLIFDHDGTISKPELADMISLGLSGLCGGVLGFAAGGPSGAMIGATVAIGLWGALKNAEFFSDGKVGDLTSQLATALTTLTGAVIGFTVGGPGGALIGAAIGIGLSMAIGAITFDGSAHPGYRSGLDWFVIEVLGLPSDEELKSWGTKAVTWVGDGVKEAMNEVALVFTGMTWDELDTWLDNGGQLIEAWVKDLPKKVENLGINIANSIAEPFVSGINSIIGSYNEFVDGIQNSEFAPDWLKNKFSKIDPLEFELIPTIPEEELNKNYNATKEKLEEDSKKKPIEVASSASLVEAKNNFPSDKVGKYGRLLVPASANIQAWRNTLPTTQTGNNGRLLLPTSANLQKFRNSFPSASLDSSNRLMINSRADLVRFQRDFPSANVDSSNRLIIPSRADLVRFQRDFPEAKIDEKGRVIIPSLANLTKREIGFSTTFDAIANFLKWLNNLGTPSVESQAALKTWTDSLPSRPTIDVQARIRSSVSEIASGGVLNHGVWSSIPKYAKGTTRAHGSLFVAGEAGPEVVGHVGGRTEVLNRSQMAATMYAAVKSAMSSVNFNVYGGGVSAPMPSDSTESEEMLYRAFSRALADSDLGGDIELDGGVLYSKMVNRNRLNTRLTGVNAMA